MCADISHRDTNDDVHAAQQNRIARDIMLHRYKDDMRYHGKTR